LFSKTERSIRLKAGMKAASILAGKRIGDFPIDRITKGYKGGREQLREYWVICSGVEDVRVTERFALPHPISARAEWVPEQRLEHPCTDARIAAELKTDRGSSGPFDLQQPETSPESSMG
jgi:hypothetical protein